MRATVVPAPKSAPEAAHVNGNASQKRTAPEGGLLKRHVWRAVPSRRLVAALRWHEFELRVVADRANPGDGAFLGSRIGRQENDRAVHVRFSAHLIAVLDRDLALGAHSDRRNVL